MGLDTEYLGRLHASANRTFETMGLEVEGTPQVLALLTLYASIVEQAYSVYVLASSRSFAGIPPVVRTLIESHVEFVNIQRDPDYLDLVAARDSRQRLSMLRAASSLALPTMPPELADGIALQIERLECERRLRRVEGLRIPDVKERFARAGLTVLYSTMYINLSSVIHSNWSTLASKHHESEGELVHIRVHGEPEPHILHSYLYAAASSLQQVAQQMHAVLGCVPPDDLLSLIDEVKLRPLECIGEDLTVESTRRAEALD